MSISVKVCEGWRETKKWGRQEPAAKQADDEVK